MTYEIKEYGSCYELVKIVDSGYYNSVIGRIWFDPKSRDIGILTKEKAYEIITTLKKQLEEESKGFKFCCNSYGCCDKYGQEKV